MEKIWRRKLLESFERYNTFAKGIAMMTVARFKNFVKLENTKPAHLEKHSRVFAEFHRQMCEPRNFNPVDNLKKRFSAESKKPLGGFTLKSVFWIFFRERE